MQWACMLFLVSLVWWGGQGAVISNYSLYADTILAACTSAPAWKLNLCNLTCATCMGSNSDLCASCDDDFLYESSYCYTSNASNTYYFTSLLA